MPIYPAQWNLLPDAPALPPLGEKSIEEWVAELVTHGDRVASQTERVGDRYRTIAPPRQAAVYRQSLSWPYVRFRIYVNVLKRYRLNYTLDGVSSLANYRYSLDPYGGGQLAGAGSYSGILAGFGSWDYSITLSAWDRCRVTFSNVHAYFETPAQIIGENLDAFYADSTGDYSITVRNNSPDNEPYVMDIAIMPVENLPTVGSSASSFLGNAGADYEASGFWKPYKAAIAGSYRFVGSDFIDVQDTSFNYLNGSSATDLTVAIAAGQVVLVGGSYDAIEIYAEAV